MAGRHGVPCYPDPRVGDPLPGVLLLAGHEITVTAIGTGALLLLDQPAQWEALAADPALVPAVVEEVLRAGGQGGGGLPPVRSHRLADRRCQVEAGDLVLLDNGAANHDRTVLIPPGGSDFGPRGSAPEGSAPGGWRAPAWKPGGGRTT